MFTFDPDQETMDNMRRVFALNDPINGHNNVDDGENGDDINNNIIINNENNDNVNEYEAMVNLNNHPTVFFLNKLRNKQLEKLSIRNVGCYVPPTNENNYEEEIEMSQNVLIKFVRNAPSTLVWLRSDLSTANIQLLQSERPGIEFVQ